LDFQADYQTELAGYGSGSERQTCFPFRRRTVDYREDRALPRPAFVRLRRPLRFDLRLTAAQWRHVFGVTRQTPSDITLTSNWRFIGSSTLDSNITGPSLTNGSIDRVNGKIGDYSYLDLSAAWQADELINVRADVTNVFDLDPPILDDAVTGSGTPNPFNSYDLLGCRIFVAVTDKF
jgi:hypothetical protein